MRLVTGGRDPLTHASIHAISVGMGSAVLMGIVFGPTMDGRVVEVRARAPQAAQALTLLPALMVEQALRGVVPQGHRALLNPRRPPKARGGSGDPRW